MGSRSKQPLSGKAKLGSGVATARQLELAVPMEKAATDRLLEPRASSSVIIYPHLALRKAPIEALKLSVGSALGFELSATVTDLSSGS